MIHSSHLRLISPRSLIDCPIRSALPSEPSPSDSQCCLRIVQQLQVIALLQPDDLPLVVELLDALIHEPAHRKRTWSLADEQ